MDLLSCAQLVLTGGFCHEGVDSKTVGSSKICGGECVTSLSSQSLENIPNQAFISLLTSLSTTVQKHQPAHFHDPQNAFNGRKQLRLLQHGLKLIENNSIFFLPIK